MGKFSCLGRTGIANIRGLRVKPPQASDHITQAIVDYILQAIHNIGMLDSPAISSLEDHSQNNSKKFDDILAAIRALMVSQMTA